MSEEKSKRDWANVRRSSSNQISFRATEAEAELVRTLASEAGLSVAEYVRTRATGGVVKSPTMRREDSQNVVKSLFAIENELARQGNNLNQLAKQANGYRLFLRGAGRDELTNELEKLSEAHTEVLNTLQGIWRSLS